LTPDTIAHYRIGRKLGQGGMGEVYQATDTKLGREVAVKRINAEVGQDASRLARFLREAQVLASLNHPNIAAIYGVEDGALIMELVEGPTLAERIAKGPVSIEEALPIARQIAEALEAAHEQGIVHRDLKPANIKVRSDGTVKVLDFGLAKLTDSGPPKGGPHISAGAPDSPTLEGAQTDAGATISRPDPVLSPTMTSPALVSSAGMILGTAAYMSPEQARGKGVDKRADIWAFGVVLYEMLTGATLFTGETVTDVLASVVRQDPDLSRVPAHVRPLLRRCLEKDPRRRLRDIGDAMPLLETAAEARMQAAPAIRWPVWTASAIAALFSAAFAAVSFVHFRESPPVRDAVRLQMSLPEDVSFTQSGVFALSPDGRTVAFAAYGADGVSRVWIRSLDSVDARPLRDAVVPQTAYPFFWSPDSRFVAFFADGALKKIDVNGGPPQVIAEKVPLVAGGSWNRDGVILFGSGRGIMRVAADGGTASPVTTPATGEVAHAFPVFLPDGRRFLYLRVSQELGARAIHLAALDTAPDQQSTTPVLRTDYGAAVAPTADGTADADAVQVLFLRQGTLLAQSVDLRQLTLTGEAIPVAEQVAGAANSAIGHFSVSQTGSLLHRTATGGNYQLTWFDREGNNVGTGAEPARYGTLKLSPDGTKAVSVIVDQRSNSQDIWQIDLDKGMSQRVTFDAGADQSPVWSPDGQRIAWQANRSGVWSLLQRPANGSGSEEILYSFPEKIYPPSLTDWSHDGRFLVYGAAGDIFALPLAANAAGRREPIPVVKTPTTEFGAYVSPDGRWIAYMSSESGRQEIYVQGFSAGSAPTAGKWVVSKGTRGMARWRSDSRELLFLSLEGAVMSVDVSAKPVFEASAPRKLFQLPLALLGVTQNPGTVTDVTRDGQRILLTLPVEERARQELSVILNWQQIVTDSTR
jgi:Tol biopolymer transport system component